MQKIVPNLWYDGAAVEAAEAYVGLVPNSRLGEVIRYGEVGQEIHGQMPGSVMLQTFELGGTTIAALNGGPLFRFTPAISLFVTLPDRAAVDRLWNGLIDGGEALMAIDKYPWSERYGWLNDRWGLSWQITQGDPALSGRMVLPHLSFAGAKAGTAEAAVREWVRIFPGSSVGHVSRFGANGIPPAPGGGEGVAHGSFTLMGESFMFMDAFGPHSWDFNEAVSLLVRCEDQAEIDRLWAALSAVPEAEACGWVKDRNGVSWQISPLALEKIIADSDQVKVDRTMGVLLTMKKLDLAVLEAAYAG